MWRLAVPLKGHSTALNTANRIHASDRGTILGNSDMGSHVLNTLSGDNDTSTQLRTEDSQGGGVTI